MSNDNAFWLLLGPVGAVGFYWAMYRYYRNTDKSHAFERETRVDVKHITGSDRQVDTIIGTRESRIRGNNVGDYRQRVRRRRGS
jgi:hypothetical protein